MNELAINSLSPSKIGNLMRCPLQAKLRYADHIPETSAGIMLAGRAFHSAMELALREVVSGNLLPPIEVLDNRFLENWKAETQKEEAKEGFLMWDWGTEKPEAVREDYRGLVQLARKSVLPNLRPKLIEHKIRMDMNSAAGPFRLYGVIDLVEADNSFSDWKTVDRLPKNVDKPDIQMSAYGTWMSETTGLTEVVARKIFMIRGKRPRVEIKEKVIRPPHMEWFRDTAAKSWQMIRANAFVANTNGWWCCPDFCSFYGACVGDL